MFNKIFDLLCHVIYHMTLCKLLACSFMKWLFTYEYKELPNYPNGKRNPYE